MPQPTAPESVTPKPPTDWKYVLGTAAGAFLGVVLLVGLYAKALDPEAFVETIAHEGLDFLLPAGMVAAIALGLEAILGFGLVLGLRRLRILLPSACLVGFFVFLTARAYITYDPASALDETSCGCFGNLVERSPAEAFWQDLLLLVPACVLAFVARPHRAAPHTRARFIAAISGTACVLIFSWFSPDLPLDDIATRLRPGVHAADLCAGEDAPGAKDAASEDDDAGDDDTGDDDPGDGDGTADGSTGDDTSEDEAEGRVCLTDMIPELAEGAYVIVLADLDDPALHAKVPAFNTYALDEIDAPPLYVMAIATEDDVGRFDVLQQPVFAVLEGHAAVLRPLYRRLPRSFLVRDGRVTHTWQGWPPLADLAAKAKPPTD